MPDLPSGTVTFLFTDIQGSSRLWEERADQMPDVLARHHELIRGAVGECGGAVFKTVGDGACAVFGTAPEALSAALAIQQLMAKEPWPNPIVIRVRMALHTGTAEPVAGDYAGPALNRVSRLLSAAQGGQVLVSRITAELCRGRLPQDADMLSLGEHHLRDLREAEHIWQLLHPALQCDYPPIRTADAGAPRTNLPRSLTSYIGREAERAEVRSLLRKSRLLTLSGAGGCGKTRLAYEVAGESIEGYPDGVWVAELAPLTNPALVPSVVLAALGASEIAAPSPEQQLLSHLKGKALLLILDNCEHLIASCASLASTILRFCPGVRILATSRERLNIAGEHALRVPSLTMPESGSPLTADAMTRYEATRLFIDRASQHRATFTVTERNAATVAHLCRQLDGIPLAIELAAAQIRAMSVDEIDARLDNRFRLLIRGDRAALPRQQTLRALIDWGYELLDDHERRLFARLSVFSGGWTLQAAEAVCAGPTAQGDEIDPGDILLLLSNLIDKSVVVPIERDGATRYGLLETLRQYGTERLLEAGEEERVRDLHLNWVAAMATDAGKHMTGPAQVEWLDLLEAEHDNIRTALAWCRLSAERAAVAVRIAGALWRFWHTHGHLSEGRDHIERALEFGETAAADDRARALNGAGALAYAQGAYGVANSRYSRALEIYRQLGDGGGASGALNNLGLVAYITDDLARARELFQECLTIDRASGDRRGVAATLNNLGLAASSQGEYANARSLFDESLDIYGELGDRRGMALSYLNLGQVAAQEGDYDAARAQIDRSMAIKRDLGDRQGIGRLLTSMALVSRAVGDLSTASSQLAESLDLSRELGDREGMASALAGMAAVAVDRADYREAVSLYGDCLCLFQELADRTGLADALEGVSGAIFYDGDARKAVRLLAAADRVRASVEVCARRSPERCAALLAEAKAALDSTEFDAAWEEGLAMTVDEAVACAGGGRRDQG